MIEQTANNIVHGMIQPRGELLELRYSSMADQSGESFQPVVNVLFRCPDGTREQRYYNNSQYSVENQHLQLMAAIGAKPTEYDGTTLDLRDHNVVVPLVYNDAGGDQGGWHLSQAVFKRGKEALQSADWNEFGEDSAIEINIGGSDE